MNVRKLALRLHFVNPHFQIACIFKVAARNHVAFSLFVNGLSVNAKIQSGICFCIRNRFDRIGNHHIIRTVRYQMRDIQIIWNDSHISFRQMLAYEHLVRSARIHANANRRFVNVFNRQVFVLVFSTNQWGFTEGNVPLGYISRFVLPCCG